MSNYGQQQQGGYGEQKKGGYARPGSGRAQLSLFKFNRVIKGRPPHFIYDDVVRDQHIDAITKLSVSTEPLRVREPVLSDPLFVQVLLRDVYFSEDSYRREEAIKYLYSFKLYAQLPADTGTYRKGEMHRMVSFYTDAETGALRPATKDQFDVLGHPTVANHWTGLRESQGVPLVITPNRAQAKTPYQGIAGEDSMWTGQLPAGLKFQYDPVYIYRTRDRVITPGGELGPWGEYTMWPANLQCSEEQKNWATDPAKDPYVEVVRHPCGQHQGVGKNFPFYREYTLALRVDSRGLPCYSGRIHGAPHERIDDTYPITCTNKYGSFTYNWYVEVDDAPPQFSSRYNAGGGPGYRKQRSITSGGQVQDFPINAEGSVEIVLEVGMQMDVAVPQMMEGDYTSEAEVDLQMGMEQKVRHFGQTQMWQVYTRDSSSETWKYTPSGLPEGIVMDQFTGVISGNAQRAQPRREYRILARNNMFRVLEKPADKAARYAAEEAGADRCFCNEAGERVDFRDDGGDQCCIHITVRAVAPEWIGYTYMKAVHSVDSKITPNPPIMFLHGSPTMFLQAWETNQNFTPLIKGDAAGGGGYGGSPNQGGGWTTEFKQLPNGLDVDQNTGCIHGCIITPNNCKPIISVDVGRESPFYQKTLDAIARYGPFVDEDLSGVSHGRSPVVQRSECFHKFYIDALTAVNLNNRAEDYSHPLAKNIIIETKTGRAFIRNTTHVYMRVIDTPPLIHCYNDMHPRYRLGQPIPVNSPQVVAGQGGDVDFFTCGQGSLPEGLTLDRYTGEIRGTPKRITHTHHGDHHKQTEIFAQNSGGSCLIRLHITVMDAVPVIEYLVKAHNLRDPERLPVEIHDTGLKMTSVDIDLRTRNRQGGRAGHGVQHIELYPRIGGCELTPESTSQFRFTMEGHAPAGLTINARTGEISGTVSGQNYLGVTKSWIRIRCTNTAGSSADFIIRFTIWSDGAPQPNIGIQTPATHAMKIILIGPRGAGKSTITRVASESTSNIGHVKVGGLNSAQPGSVRPQCTVIRIDHPDGRGGKLSVELWDAATWLTKPNMPLPAPAGCDPQLAFRGTHPHLADGVPADGAIVVFSADSQGGFPQSEVNAWLAELRAHNRSRGNLSGQKQGCVTMLMMNKIDKLRSTTTAGQSPAMNVDERIARNFQASAQAATSQIEMSAQNFAHANEMMFAKTCAIDDRNVDRYDNHKGHTTYASFNAVVQKIYQLKRNMDFTPHQRPTSPRININNFQNQIRMEADDAGCAPALGDGNKQCSIQ